MTDEMREYKLSDLSLEGDITPDSEASVGQQTSQPASKMTPEQRKMMWGLIIGSLVFLALVILGLVYLFRVDPGETARIRDVFIILMAMMSLLTSVVLVILIVQLSSLINLIQNEIRPILDSTNQAVSHLRGTTVFLSDHLVEPVVKLNEYLAGLMQLLHVIGIARKKPNK